MRKAFSTGIIDLAEKDKNVIFLTGDLGFQTFDAFKNKFPLKYLNVGIAEAQMASMAAGLALEGFKPIIYSIAAFVTGRAYEQIRISINYHQLPVIIVGAGGGYLYSTSGVTHHAADDLGLMSLLPGMTVVAPGDPSEVACLLPQLAALNSPSYIRIGRYGEPSYHSDEPITLGKGRKIRSGEQIALLSTGDSVMDCLHAIDELVQLKKINPALYQFHTVKPIDTELLFYLSQEFDTLVTIEEHSPIGGLSSAVNNWAIKNKNYINVINLNPPDKLILGNPELTDLRADYQYDSQAIVKLCCDLWK